MYIHIWCKMHTKAIILFVRFSVLAYLLFSAYNLMPKHKYTWICFKLYVSVSAFTRIVHIDYM